MDVRVCFFVVFYQSLWNIFSRGQHKMSSCAHIFPFFPHFQRMSFWHSQEPSETSFLSGVKNALVGVFPVSACSDSTFQLTKPRHLPRNCHICFILILTFVNLICKNLDRNFQRHAQSWLGPGFSFGFYTAIVFLFPSTISLFKNLLDDLTLANKFGNFGRGRPVPLKCGRKFWIEKNALEEG